MTPAGFRLSSGVGAGDPGCEEVFEAMDQYVDAVLLGEDSRIRFARLVLHLRACVTCREDTEGLLAALETGRSPAPR